MPQNSAILRGESSGFVQVMKMLGQGDLTNHVQQTARRRYLEDVKPKINAP